MSDRPITRLRPLLASPSARTPEDGTPPAGPPLLRVLLRNRSAGAEASTMPAVSLSRRHERCARHAAALQCAALDVPRPARAGLTIGGVVADSSTSGGSTCSSSRHVEQLDVVTDLMGAWRVMPWRLQPRSQARGWPIRRTTSAVASRASFNACVERSAERLAQRHFSAVSTSSAARSEGAYDAGVL